MSEYDMTEKRLREICKERGHYQTPHLNDILYFHYKGFRKIDNIAPYLACKSLWLEGNGIAKIENLEALTQLTCLYLQENLIQKIENLPQISLRQINFSNNSIQVIENISHLTALESLYVSQNRISHSQALRGLIGLDNLSVLDLSKNQIDDEEFLGIFEQLPNLRVLTFSGNPISKTMKMYRKRILNACKELTYLDDRPVFADERRATAAFFIGGAEAEINERRLILAEKRADERAQFAGMQAFLSGKTREEALEISESARQKVLTRFNETGEIDAVEKVSRVSTVCGVGRGQIWADNEVQVVSREFFEGRVGLEIIEIEDDDVPELEEEIDDVEEAVVGDDMHFNEKDREEAERVKQEEEEALKKVLLGQVAVEEEEEAEEIELRVNKDCAQEKFVPGDLDEFMGSLPGEMAKKEPVTVPIENCLITQEEHDSDNSSCPD